VATATQSGDESCEPPGAPSPFAALNVTQQQLKRASKKRDKLARRAARAGGGGTPAPAEPVQTALGFGAFEAHTSGFGSRILRAYGFSGQGTASAGRAQALQSRSRSPGGPSRAAWARCRLCGVLLCRCVA
jgi:hypothetical protein